MVWYSYLFKNFPQLVIHTVKGSSVVSEAEVSQVASARCLRSLALDFCPYKTGPERDCEGPSSFRSPLTPFPI